MSSVSSSSHNSEQNDSDMVIESISVESLMTENRDLSGKENNQEVIQIEQSQDKLSGTYTLYNQDHTLGNLLKNALNQNKDVDLCGYALTHPQEKTIRVRIQSSSQNTNQVMIQGLDTVSNLATELKAQVLKAQKNFKVKA